VQIFLTEFGPTVQIFLPELGLTVQIFLTELGLTELTALVISVSDIAV
jgi:hypothetical protein